MAKTTRSPNYPSMNLGDAIERTKKIYKEEGSHPAAREVIAKDLGYGSLNGASLSAISALLQYGLLEKSDDDGLRVTSDAITLFELKQGERERADAIVKTAYSPKLFADLSDAFGDRLPSDQNLRLWLIRRGFNQKAADGVIRVYRETLELVNAEAGAYNADEMKPQAQNQESQQKPSYQGIPMEMHRLMNPTLDNQMRVQELAQEISAESLNIRISPDCRARVLFDGPVTQEGIDKLIRYLGLAKDDYPSGKQTTARAIQERNAQWIKDNEYSNVRVISEPFMKDGQLHVKAIQGQEIVEIPESELKYV